MQARSQYSSSINFDKSNKLIHEIVDGKIIHEEALNEMADIRNNMEILNGLNEFNSNQVKVLNILFMVDEIFTGESKRYKLSGTKYLLLKSKSNKKIRHSGTKI